MADAEEKLAQVYLCGKCHHRGAVVQRLAMSGTGLSRLFEVQPYQYAFVSCRNCGYTEVYNLEILEGRDDMGAFLEILFSN